MRAAIFFVAVFGWPAIVSLRTYAVLAQRAAALRKLARDDRRVDIYGAWYRELRRIRASVPERASVDIVMANADARDTAVFAGAMLEPRDVRYFAGWDAFRRRERARFLLDARAANAPPGPPPGPADAVLLIDEHITMEKR